MYPKAVNINDSEHEFFPLHISISYSEKIKHQLHLEAH